MEETVLRWLADMIADNVEAVSVQKWSVGNAHLAMDGEAMFFTKDGKHYQVALHELDEIPDVA